MKLLKKLITGKEERPFFGASKKELFEMTTRATTEKDTWQTTREITLRRFSYEDYAAQREKLVAQAAGYQDKANEVTPASFTFTGVDGPRLNEEAAASIRRSYQKKADQVWKQIEKIDNTPNFDPDPEKNITAEELADYYRARYQTQYDTGMALYKEGRLMEAQRYGFGSFIEAGAEVQKKDTAAFHALREAAEMAGHDRAEEYVEVAELYATRVRTEQGVRKKFKDKDGSIMNPHQMNADTKNDYWIQQKNYNRKTRQRNWKDDSGVAYDDRQNGQEETA